MSHPPLHPTPGDPEGLARWPRFDRVPRVVFLDVDGTLLPRTTSFLLAARLIRLGHISRRAYTWSAWYGLRHRIGSLDYAGLVRSSLPVLGRIPLVDLERMSYDCFVEEVRPRLFRGVVDHLNSLRASGSSLVLVSSSPEFVIAPLGHYLGCTDLIASPLKIDRGRIAGLSEGTLCYGPGKQALVATWAADRGISMDDTAGYADNWSDRFLLVAVGHAVAVSPHGRFRRLAHRHGWTVVRPLAPPRS
jgi:HAD superfamily hydrolase (TIGR01490 family)